VVINELVVIKLIWFESVSLQKVDNCKYIDLVSLLHAVSGSVSVDSLQCYVNNQVVICYCYSKYAQFL
jgi:hypothetical protein